MAGINGGILGPVNTGKSGIFTMDELIIGERFAGGGSLPSDVESLACDILVVAGGGGTGGSPRGGGGGGAGGAHDLRNVALKVGSQVTVIIAAGGLGTGVPDRRSGDGGDSLINSIRAIGGGGGGNFGDTNAEAYRGYPGGSGGGSNGTFGYPGGTGIRGQGFNGSAGNNVWDGTGAGGGAGGLPTIPADQNFRHVGGAGIVWLDGKTYARGGDGGGLYASPGELPGNGLPNSGFGGSPTGGSPVAVNGAAGVVKIRYVGSPRFNDGIVTESGGFTFHEFTTSTTFIVR